MTDQVRSFCGTPRRLAVHLLMPDPARAPFSSQEWDAVIAVHLKGAFAMSKAVWPIMRSQKVCCCQSPLRMPLSACS